MRTSYSKSKILNQIIILANLIKLKFRWVLQSAAHLLIISNPVKLQSTLSEIGHVSVDRSVWVRWCCLQAGTLLNVRHTKIALQKERFQGCLIFWMG